MIDRRLWLYGALVLAAGIAIPLVPAVAATSGGGNLPWETPLQTLRDSITGPVAYASPDRNCSPAIGETTL